MFLSQLNFSFVRLLGVRMELGWTRNPIFIELCCSNVPFGCIPSTLYRDHRSNYIGSTNIDIVLHRASCTQSMERFLMKTLYNDALASGCLYIKIN